MTHQWKPDGFTPHPVSGGLMPTDRCACGAIRHPYSPEYDSPAASLECPLTDPPSDPPTLLLQFRTLLHEFVERYPGACVLDRDGFCETHRSWSPCIVAATRRLLGEEA